MTSDLDSVERAVVIDIGLVGHGAACHLVRLGAADSPVRTDPATARTHC